jgi:hypothetical protein
VQATTVWPGLRSGSPPRKNDSSARVLTRTAAAVLIRATVKHRVDNEAWGAAVANHRRRRSDRSRAVFPTVGCRGANSRSAPATPPSLWRRARRVTGRAWGRRLVRGVRSEDAKSGLKVLRAPSPAIRHRRTGQPVTDTIPGCRSNHPRRGRHRQLHRRKARFSTPSNQEPTPGSPGEPTLRTFRKCATASRRPRR